METSQKVVTRFAPSPTGFVHIGGLRTALYAWLLAKKNGGTFILRIEDTDKAREVEGSIDHIQESLKWLGIEPDFGPGNPGPFGSCIQSERLDTYLEWANKLIAKGLAYPDPYTAEEVEVFRQKAQEEKRPFLYRDHRPETFGTWDGTTALRFKVPEIKRHEWFDEVRGDLTAGPEALDDIVIIKADGYPVYAFAHIIDDYNMGVTHVLRADEWIASTPRFLSLYDALEIPRPKLATLPPILRTDKTKKLGKRDGAKDVLDYKKEGYLPEAMMNYLAFIGWNPGTEQELFTKEELIEAFTLDRIQKGGGTANEEKLDWINREYIKKMNQSQFWTNGEVFVPNWVYMIDTEYKMLAKIEQLLRDRIEKFSDIATLFEEGELDYFFKEPEFEPSMMVWKALKDTPDGLEVTKGYLTKVVEILEALPEESWNYESIKESLMSYAEEVGKGNVLWPMRVALSGRDKSPDPFELASILEKETTLKRIKAVL